MFLCLQKLRGSWSKRLGDLAKDVFLTSVPALSKVSAERCEKLWLDLEQELVAHLQQAECTTKLQLEDMKTQMDKERQVDCLVSFSSGHLDSFINEDSYFKKSLLNQCTLDIFNSLLN